MPPRAPSRTPRRVELNGPLIRNVRSESKAFNLWDTQLRGLCLRVQPTGHKAFKAVYSDGSKPCWYHIGPYPAVGLADARKTAKKVLLKAANGEDPLGERRVARARRHEADDTDTEVAAVRTFIDGAQPSLLPANAGGPTVYFAALGRATKIGFTTDLEARLKILQAGTGEKVKLVAALPGGRELERQFHRALSSAKISGEFFQTEAVMEFLVNITNEMVELHHSGQKGST